MRSEPQPEDDGAHLPLASQPRVGGDGQHTLHVVVGVVGLDVLAPGRDGELICTGVDAEGGHDRHGGSSRPTGRSFCDLGTLDHGPETLSKRPHDEVPVDTVETRFGPINIEIEELNTLPNRSGQQSVLITTESTGT